MIFTMVVVISFMWGYTMAALLPSPLGLLLGAAGGFAIGWIGAVVANEMENG